MNVLKKLVFLVCVVCFAFMPLVQTAMAEEVAPTNTAVESPSVWAIWDVQMAYTYGLGTVDTYKGYKDEITASQLETVLKSFEEKFGVNYDSKLKLDSIATRGDVIKGLYGIINLSVKPNGNNSAVDYFARNALIKGRTVENYSLDRVCTNEEMIVFAKRAYDHIVYSLGKDAKGCFWKVSDEDNTVYLLGSIHASDNSLYPLSKDILTSFANSQALVVEVNLLAQKPEELQYAQQLMFYEGDDTIEKHISSETYKKYVEFMESVGVPADTYNRIKPWAAALTIQNLQLASADISGAMGIDVYFMTLANGNLPIIEIEGSKYQYDMFNSFSPELQESQLIGSLTADSNSEENSAESVAVVKEMLGLWKTGDTNSLEKMLFGVAPTNDLEKEYNKKLWDDRNENMAKYVLKMLQEDTENDYFLIVGAGHMLNHNGIVELLIKAGYTVEQVK